MMDDWDSVSSPVNSQDDGVTDWDAVSIPQPQRPRQPVKIAVSRRLVLLVLAGLVIVAAAGGAVFAIYHASVIHTASVNATATAQARATVQAIASVTTLQQMYTQDTSGAPFIDDPLRDNSQGYAADVNLGGGDTCELTGGAYHVDIANSGYSWMWCASKSINLNNFAFQVQEIMVRPGDAGIVFGSTANSFYRMDVGSAGTFTLYYQHTNKQIDTLQSGSSAAIKSGLNNINVIALIVNNGNLYLYVNSQFVMSANLSVSGIPYQPGAFGFGAQNFGQPTEIVYSNLKVWLL